MDVMARIEDSLTRALMATDAPGCPPGLSAAMTHAVFPGGARIRPKLCLAVAQACGDPSSAVSLSAAAAIELLHCASLAHDDLPCFDDAPLRRGKPSVHVAFGERLAVLAGDALIVLAFETIVRGAALSPDRLAALLLTVARSVGAPCGIVAGQAWECERSLDLAEYHREKTGSLFVASTMAGAAAAGADPAPWHALGDRLGEAFQVADDLRDVVCKTEDLGKPAGRDAALGRPSAALELGVAGATLRLERLLAEATDSIPACPGEAELRAIVVKEAACFLPKELVRIAA